jgi:hypothetical protein
MYTNLITDSRNVFVVMDALCMATLDQKPAHGKYDNTYSSIKRSRFVVFT